MSVRITLDADAALALFGGTDEASVEISQRIASLFAERRLKEIAESATFEKVAKDLKKEISQEARRALGAVEKSWSSGWRFTNDSVLVEMVSELVKRSVDEEIGAVMQKHVDQRIKEHKAALNIQVDNKFKLLERQILDRVNQIFGEQVDKWVELVIVQRLRTLSKERAGEQEG